MDAPQIMARTMSVPRATGKTGALWQYHSRSDHHSQVSCWAVLFDLLQESALLREHVESAKIFFGVNHRMTDFVHKKKKKLDLIVCRPDGPPRRRSFADLGDHLGISLTANQRAVMDSLPEFREAAVGSPLIALEAKACMTEHVKSLPRLYDELNSSHQIVHGASSRALSIGMVTVNMADTFVSSDRNKLSNPHMRRDVTMHKQPESGQRVVEMIEGLPRRTSSTAEGFDGIGIVALRLKNDCETPVTVHSGRPAPSPGEIFHYETMLRRMAAEYDSAFSKV